MPTMTFILQFRGPRSRDWGTFWFLNLVMQHLGFAESGTILRNRDFQSPIFKNRGFFNFGLTDRAFEISNRVGADSVKTAWDPSSSPNALTYKRGNDEVELVVVQRKIEPPSESGFGSDELYRIKASAGGAFSALNVYRAARVRRRWRRGFDETSGKRIVDGLEITTTYRVLDGVAGIEMPTSTCKSRIRLEEL